MASLLRLAKACDSNQFDVVTDANISNFQINENICIKELNSENKYTCNRSTCLHIAHQYSSFVIAKHLIANGASINVHNGNKDTVLHSACKSFIDARQKVQFIFEIAPHLLNKGNKNYLLPIHIAAMKNDSELCLLLLKAGADVGV